MGAHHAVRIGALVADAHDDLLALADVAEMVDVEVVAAERPGPVGAEPTTVRAFDLIPDRADGCDGGCLCSFLRGEFAPMNVDADPNMTL